MDRFVRITLRLPGELHRQLVDGRGAKSMNAEIVGRLEQSFARGKPMPERHGNSVFVRVTAEQQLPERHGSGVFVRALDPDGRAYSADALDLDERSFRRFVLDWMNPSRRLDEVEEPYRSTKRKGEA